MFRPVMQQVASLAECPDIAMPPAAMSRVMVEMGCSEYDPCRSYCRYCHRNGWRYGLAAAVAPGLAELVPPAAVAEMADDGAVRTAASLAPTGSPLEPDPAADLRPVDRVEKAQLRSDRHGV